MTHLCEQTEGNLHILDSEVEKVARHLAKHFKVSEEIAVGMISMSILHGVKNKPLISFIALGCIHIAYEHGMCDIKVSLGIDSSIL